MASTMTVMACQIAWTQIAPAIRRSERAAQAPVVAARAARAAKRGIGEGRGEGLTRVLYRSLDPKSRGLVVHNNNYFI
jgi:hypothetical protein